MNPKYIEISNKLTENLETLRTENRGALNELKESMNALLAAVASSADYSTKRQSGNEGS